MAPARRTLILFLKEPVPGRVKTRLGREIGHVAAAWWFRHQVAGLIRRVGRDPRWRTVLAVAPDHAGLASRAWPPDLPRVAQGTGGLGARMARTMAAMPPGPVLLIGSDVPGVGAGHVARAFGTLGGQGAVLGPSGDGGFWAVGLARGGAAVPAGIFDGARFSSPHALADTLASLAPLSVGYADSLDDVDTAADLQRLCGAGAFR